MIQSAGHRDTALALAAFWGVDISAVPSQPSAPPADIIDLAHGGDGPIAPQQNSPAIEVPDESQPVAPEPPPVVPRLLPGAPRCALCPHARDVVLGVTRAEPSTNTFCNGLAAFGRGTVALMEGALLPSTRS